MSFLGLLSRQRWRLVAVTLLCVVVVQFFIINYSHTVSNNTEKVDLSWPRYVQDEEEEDLGLFEDTEAQKSQIFAEANIYPVPRREKGFLTIGIPTIGRTGVSYLLQTIASLLFNMSPEEKEEVTIVVFLADSDKSLRLNRSEEIKFHFGKYIESGMIHIIQAPSSYYPEFNITKVTYRQTKKYIQWRAKQCYDYAYLLEYSVDLSDYYMQLEDDVVTSLGYIEAIKTFMKDQPDKLWVCLEFSELGFIGKLYRSSDIEKLAALLKLFYIEQPVDYTYLHFNLMSYQRRQRMRRPSLFQHKGVKSSFTGKIQRLVDRFYSMKTNREDTDNPPADVFSSMTTYLTYRPHLAYSKERDGYFWGLGKPRAGQNLTVAFHKPQQLRRVTIVTGTDIHPEDMLYNGTLEVGFTLTTINEQVTCINTLTIGHFHKGVVDVDNLHKRLRMKAACLMIKVIENQEPWLIVSDIRVSVAKLEKRHNDTSSSTGETTYSSTRGTTRSLGVKLKKPTAHVSSKKTL